MGPEILQFRKLEGGADSAGSGPTLSVATGLQGQEVRGAVQVWEVPSERGDIWKGL